MIRGTFSPDGRSILTGGPGDTAILADKRTGQVLRSFETHDNFLRGLEVSTVDRVYNALYRPDLVREKLAGDPGGKVRSAAARLDLDKVVASGSPPKIRILSPDSASRAAPETVTVEAGLADQGGGIGKVEWRVSGVTLGVEECGIKRMGDAPAAGSASTSSGKTAKVSRTLGLAPGENRVAVLAYNEAGLIASEPFDLVITLVQQAAAPPPLRALGRRQRLLGQRAAAELRLRRCQGAERRLQAGRHKAL
jgi:hypothetical protein